MIHANYPEAVPASGLRRLLQGPSISSVTLQRLTSSPPTTKPAHHSNSSTMSTKSNQNSSTMSTKSNQNSSTMSTKSNQNSSTMSTKSNQNSSSANNRASSRVSSTNNAHNNFHQAAHTVSQTTGHRFLSHHIQEIEPQADPAVPVPLPPKRSSSLLGATFLRHKRDVSVTLNPKRVSVATSTFWDGHPDMAHLVSTIGWEHVGKRRGGEERPKSALWGTSDRGVTMDSWAWGDPPAVKKGILFQQRERLLARWKERYCILTRDYLHCFRRTTSIHRSGLRLSDMGSFIFKMRLADIEDIQLETRRVGTVIVIVLPNEPKILFRVVGDNQEVLRQWFTLLQECLYMSKERRQALRTLHTGTGTTMATSSTVSRSSVSPSEGSPTSSSSGSNSNSDNEKDTLRRNLANMSIHMTQTDGNREADICDDEEDDLSAEKVVLRRDREGHVGKTSLRDFMAEGGTGSRHSMVGGTGGGYAVPRRPESWAPQPVTYNYKTPSLVPGTWLSGKRDSSARLVTPAGAPTFSRASQLYSTSRHTSEITFRKMS